MEYIDKAQVVAGTDFFFYMESNNINREMMFYGKEVIADFTLYYVFVNAPIEPLDSTISILQDRTIWIKAIHKKDKIRIEVIDHGVGIKQSELPYIWDRYYKIDKNFTRSDTGSGLGLAIAKSICLAHKVPFGTISTEKQGSTFFVEYPVVSFK